MSEEYELSLKDKVLIMKHNLKQFPSKLREKLEWWVAFHFPKRVAYLASIRIGAHATTGEYSSTCVNELTFVDAIERWD